MYSIYQHQNSSLSRHGIQRLLKVRNDIIDVFDSNRDLRPTGEYGSELRL